MRGVKPFCERSIPRLSQTPYVRFQTVFQRFTLRTYTYRVGYELTVSGRSTINYGMINAKKDAKSAKSKLMAFCISIQGLSDNDKFYIILYIHTYRDIC